MLLGGYRKEKEIMITLCRSKMKKGHRIRNSNEDIKHYVLGNLSNMFVINL